MCVIIFLSQCGGYAQVLPRPKCISIQYVSWQENYYRNNFPFDTRTQGLVPGF